jgi:hypothetical protein
MTAGGCDRADEPLKQCTRCGERKPLEQFYKQTGCKNSLTPHCKACKRAACKKWHQSNPRRNRYNVTEARKRYIREWQLNNPNNVKASRKKWLQSNPTYWTENVNGNWKRFFGCLRRLYRRRELITTDQLLELLEKQKYRCALSGQQMTCIRGQGAVVTNASLDRIIAGGPYTIDNIQLVCHAINVARRNLPIFDFIDMCRTVTKHNDANPHVQFGEVV